MECRADWISWEDYISVWELCKVGGIWVFFMENVMGFVFGVLNEIGWVVKGGVCFFRCS